VLSHRYWQQRFNGNQAVVGKQVNLNNVAFTIIGVTPPGFEARCRWAVAGRFDPDRLEPQVNGERRS